MINTALSRWFCVHFRIPVCLSVLIAEEFELRLLLCGIAPEDHETVSIIYVVVPCYMNYRQTKRSLGQVKVKDRVNSVDPNVRSAQMSDFTKDRRAPDRSFLMNIKFKRRFSSLETISVAP